MHVSRTPRAALAAALSTGAISGPVLSEHATPPSVGPTEVQVTAVIGPTIITTAPTIFVNANDQVSGVGNLSGGSAARPATGA
jgi:hypothetical protein